MLKLTTFWKTLPLIPFALSLSGGGALGAPFSGATFDPGEIDSGLPGFVGSDGLGNVTADNTVNPIFDSWATEYTSAHSNSMRT